jgi:hypothetical protein
MSKTEFLIQIFRDNSQYLNPVSWRIPISLRLIDVTSFLFTTVYINDNYASFVVSTILTVVSSFF